MSLDTQTDLSLKKTYKYTNSKEYVKHFVEELFKFSMIVYKCT